MVQSAADHIVDMVAFTHVFPADLGQNPGRRHQVAWWRITVEEPSNHKAAGFAPSHYTTRTVTNIKTLVSWRSATIGNVVSRRSRSVSVTRRQNLVSADYVRDETHKREGNITWAGLSVVYRETIPSACRLDLSSSYVSKEGRYPPTGAGDFGLLQRSGNPSTLLVEAPRSIPPTSYITRADWLLRFVRCRHSRDTDKILNRVPRHIPAAASKLELELHNEPYTSPLFIVQGQYDSSRSTRYLRYVPTYAAVQLTAAAWAATGCMGDLDTYLVRADDNCLLYPSTQRHTSASTPPSSVDHGRYIVTFPYLTLPYLTHHPPLGPVPHRTPYMPQHRTHGKAPAMPCHAMPSPSPSSVPCAALRDPGDG
ncbi:hypothetical protein CHU98_g1505 [Xylaria longipes]|nr:hypothetical protein CHU98_g1505 [Xylaria longipes]